MCRQCFDQDCSNKLKLAKGQTSLNFLSDSKVDRSSPRFGARYGENFDLSQHDMWKEKYTGVSYMSVTVHHIHADWNNLSSFIWSTTKYNLEDHTASSISKCYDFIPTAE